MYCKHIADVSETAVREASTDKAASLAFLFFTLGKLEREGINGSSANQQRIRVPDIGSVLHAVDDHRLLLFYRLIL